MFLNNRYHDPTLGHFTSVDPLVGQTGMPYLYGDGNPATLSDPTGLAACADDDNCGFAGSGTGRTSKLTDAQMKNLESDDGAVWVVQNLDVVWNACRTDWNACRDKVYNPEKVEGWDLNDSDDAAMYEAYRMTYRTMLAYQRAGVAKVDGGVGNTKGGGGRLTSADGQELSLELLAAGWDGGDYGISARWTDNDSGWAIGVSGSACLVVCLRIGIYFGSDGINPHVGFGGAGLGLAATVDVVPIAGACSQQGSGVGIAGGGGLVGGASVSGSIDSGVVPSSLELSGGVGFLQWLPSSPVGGGGSFTWMAGC